MHAYCYKIHHNKVPACTAELFLGRRGNSAQMGRGLVQGFWGFIGHWVMSIHMDTQAHAVQCNKVNESISVEGNYSDIFKDKIPTNILKSMYQILKMREGLI